MYVLDDPDHCKDPGMIVELSPRNMITVKGEYLQLFCSVHGFVLCDPTTFYSIWNISSPHFKRIISIHDNFTDPNYYLAVYQTEDLCIFINQLTIRNISLDLNGAILTCIESIYIGENERKLLSTSNVTMSEYN